MQELALSEPGLKRSDPESDRSEPSSDRAAGLSCAPFLNLKNLAHEPEGLTRNPGDLTRNPDPRTFNPEGGDLRRGGRTEVWAAQLSVQATGTRIQKSGGVSSEQKTPRAADAEPAVAIGLEGYLAVVLNFLVNPVTEELHHRLRG